MSPEEVSLVAINFRELYIYIYIDRQERYAIIERRFFDDFLREENWIFIYLFEIKTVLKSSLIPLLSHIISLFE